MRLTASAFATVSLASLALSGIPATASAQEAAKTDAQPWLDSSLPPQARVDMLLPQMTEAEKLVLVRGYFGSNLPFKQFTPPEGARPGSAGYVPGIARLNIPPQWQTDAAIGVATQGGAKEKRGRTALPSNVATAATWNPEIAYEGGKMIGAEARASGFNVMLAGGVNLNREPRNGRNFEYGGEDPYLAGIMTGAATAGIQSNNIISTIKHFAVNDQETDRNAGNSIITPAAAQMSDLLAFHIALEKSDAGSVMCSYNRVNGPFACESPWLLDEVLRKDWGFKGYVMSDWGATHSTVASVKAGLDQQSGYPFDEKPYYGELLKEALDKGDVSAADLDRMVSSILYPMFAHGLFDQPVTSAPMKLPDDMLAAHAKVTQADAEEAIVLLQNKGKILPLSPKVESIAIIGGHADKGVLAGGGSSLVYPVDGNAVPGLEPKIWPGPVMYYPSSPLEEIRKQAPNATITFVDGTDPAAAAQAAAKADVAVIFATQWAGEAFDVSLSLGDQDTVIDQVSSANPNTVVVLETGGAVFTPWAEKVSGIVEAWYPGTQGGAAIANILFGKVNPSGHLPMTFPKSLDQLPHPQKPQKGDVVYSEGATVGYKWFDAKDHAPQFAFGHGLSYTDFTHSGLSAQAQGDTVEASFTVSNIGKRAGKDVAQIYVAGEGWEAPRRLAGFAKLDLAPGESSSATVRVDPRLLAVFDAKTNSWVRAAGTYQVMLGSSADAMTERVNVKLPALTLPASWSPGL
ncbi:glycosyl hydrolase [Altererythrobacter indicus]|uniref:Glycosyl hydrolase n=2 Tax=Altericroceibacterium indicum TaxID=374177 RepID=A0A845A598_9SPHN|nr:glycosyl hydrolase [Altericroceibacterium indicum]